MYLNIGTISEASIIVSVSVSATLKALSSIGTVLRTRCHTTTEYTEGIV